MHAGMTVLGYARVSTAEQADNGYGLDAQEAAIRAECARRGWVLLEVIRDEGISGRDLDRPGVRKVLERIAQGEAGALVVAKLDRLSRSLVDCVSVFAWFRDVDAGLVALDLGVDTTTPAGRMVANVMASFGEWEREVGAQRTREALAARRHAGLPVSRPAVADTPELRERIADMRADGMTLQAIADVLNTEGVPTPRGGAQWRPSSVQAATGYKRPPRRHKPASLPAVSRRRKGRGRTATTTPGGSV